jgi:hypothetical protein
MAMEEHATLLRQLEELQTREEEHERQRKQHDAEKVALLQQLQEVRAAECSAQPFSAPLTPMDVKSHLFYAPNHSQSSTPTQRLAGDKLPMGSPVGKAMTARHLDIFMHRVRTCL